MRVKQAPE